MNNKQDSKGDVARGLAFLNDRAAVAAYQERNGGTSLARFLVDGALVMVKGQADDVVEMVCLSDLVTKTMPRPEFAARAIFLPLDEMPLYLSPSAEDFAAFNSEVEDLARAASLCV